MSRAATNIPECDHIIRHVPWKLLRRDGNDNVIDFLPQAFQRREGEDALSVGWVEFHQNPETRLRDAVWEIRRARHVGTKSAFAVAKTADVKVVCRRAEQNIRVVHEPLKDWCSHAGIRQLPRDDLTLLQALADEAFVEMVHDRDIAREPPKAA